MRASRGFTLVEVLVALLIVTLALAAAVELTGRSADDARAMRERLDAHWVGMNRLAALRAAGRYPELAGTSGEADQDGRHWFWTQAASDGPARGLRTVTIRVRLGEHGPEKGRVQGVFSRVLARPPGAGR